MIEHTDTADSGLSLLRPGLALELDGYNSDPPTWTIDTGRHGALPTRSLFDSRNEAHKPDRIQDEPQHWSLLRRTQLEIAMIHIMNAITDKPSWQHKIQTPKIAERWQSEIERELSAADTRYAESSRQLRNDPFYWGEKADRAAARFIIEELQYRSSSTDKYTPTLGLGGADILKSDILVPEDLRCALVDLVGRIDVEPVDWHPGYEGVVRDIVHPSLYPLHFGKTTVVSVSIPVERASEFAGRGIVVPVPEAPSSRYSTTSQWLPAEVRGSEGYVYFTSYINNLDEAHEDLYSALAELVRLSLPLWNQCVATEREDAPRRVPCDSEHQLWTADTKEATTPPFMPSGLHRDLDQARARDELQQLHARKWDTSTWHRAQPRLIWPMPTRFSEWLAKLTAPSSLPNRADITSMLKQQGLQIIVKIARIELHPENPVFDGGAMHIEGLPNEHICATSIYYYDSDNISGSRLSFRGGAHMGRCEYDQDDYCCLEHVYNTGLHEADAIQHLATVATPQGRLLVFPNVFQHQVLPFELHDRNKPGHRSLIVLWLVNPLKPIISTANVPPQQPEAWIKMVSALEAEYGLENARCMIQDRRKPMSKAEAERLRLDLMSERSQQEEGRSRFARMMYGRSAKGEEAEENSDSLE